MAGKSKYPPTTEERATITTMTAAGLSQTKIAKAVRRSRHLVANVQEEPETQAAVKDEKAELAAIYRDKARDVVTSISAADIGKANLLQKATSSAILLDKSLLLTGDMPSLDVSVLIDLCKAIRDKRDEEDERQFQQAKARLEGRTIEGLPDAIDRLR